MTSVMTCHDKKEKRGGEAEESYLEGEIIEIASSNER